jgi:hypothetical protein
MYSVNHDEIIYYAFKHTFSVKLFIVEDENGAYGTSNLPREPIMSINKLNRNIIILKA